jgi:glucose/arabinose dehydrogenase
MRGMIYEMAPDGSDQQVYARGLRNAVGFDFVDGTLYATENGADHLGPNAPNDVVYQLERGEHYGWPYCYEQDGVIQRDTTRSWQADFNCSEVPQSFASLEPHAAPLGITYIDNVHPALNNTMLVAQHGSFEPRVGTEPKVLRLTRTGSTTPLMRGFENAAGERVIRPVDFHRFRDGFLMSDDIGGRIFYIEPTEVEE